MASSDLENAAKIFSGTWIYDRDVGFMECVKAMKFSDEQVQHMSTVKPNMVIRRKDDAIDIEIDIGNVKHVVSFIPGKETVSKDEANPPTFHSIEILTFKDDVLTIKAWSQMPEGPGKVDYQTDMTRNGDELHTLISPIDDKSISGTRIYKLAKPTGT